jgi:hypothetical protein
VKHTLALWVITGRGLMMAMSDPTASFDMTSFCYYSSNYPGTYTVSELKDNNTTPKFKFTCSVDESDHWHYQIVNK